VQDHRPASRVTSASALSKAMRGLSENLCA
jgi:hypothetical protein